jgi:protein kinase-like protein
MGSFAPGQTIEGLTGAYVIEGTHGEGGFGVTYRARRARSGEAVLVKELRIERLKSWKALSLFEREAETLRSVRHANIPAYYDFFAYGNGGAKPASDFSSLEGDGGSLTLVLVQEFIAGESLQQAIDKGFRWTSEQVEAFLRQMLGVLAYLHELTPPVVHRDISPKNIIITPQGQPFLVDFGAIQDRIRAASGIASTSVGTMGFMPLEQLMGASRPASDLYGLAMSVIAVVGGRAPTEMPTNDRTGKLKLGPIVRGLSPEVRFALDRMVEPIVGKRIQSARAALAILDGKSRPRGKGLRIALGVGGALTLVGGAFAGLMVARRAGPSHHPSAPAAAVGVASAGASAPAGASAMATGPDGPAAGSPAGAAAGSAADAAKAVADAMGAAAGSAVAAAAGSAAVAAAGSAAGSAAVAAAGSAAADSAGAEVGAPAGSAAAEAPSAGDATILQWNGVVASVHGSGPRRGAPCALRAEVGRGSERIEVKALRLNCAGLMLYNSADELGGASSLSYSVSEIALARKPGSFRYALRYDDRGPRAGKRTQIVVDTGAREATVSKDSAPALNVLVRIEERSLPHRGSLGEPAREGALRAPAGGGSFEGAVERGVRVSSVRGLPSVKPGDVCTLRIEPERGPHNCRARVTCGDEVLYGGGDEGGRNDCVLRGGKPVAFLDKDMSAVDGDGRAEFDLLSGRAALYDNTSPARYRIEFSLRR